MAPIIMIVKRAANFFSSKYQIAHSDLKDSVLNLLFFLVNYQLFIFCVLTCYSLFVIFLCL